MASTGIVLPSLSTRDLTITNGYITTLSIAAANTEYSYVFPATIKNFSIRSRSGGKLKLSYVSAGDYRTINYGCAYCSEGIINRSSSLTIYIQSSIIDILEIEYWTN